MKLRRTILVVTLMTFTVPQFAHAACTQQEAMAKGTTLSQLVRTKMSADPTQAQALMAKMTPIMQACTFCAVAPLSTKIGSLRRVGNSLG